MLAAFRIKDNWERWIQIDSVGVQRVPVLRRQCTAVRTVEGSLSNRCRNVLHGRAYSIWVVRQQLGDLFKPVCTSVGDRHTETTQRQRRNRLTRISNRACEPQGTRGGKTTPRSARERRRRETLAQRQRMSRWGRRDGCRARRAVGAISSNDGGRHKTSRSSQGSFRRRP